MPMLADVSNLRRNLVPLTLTALFLPNAQAAPGDRIGTPTVVTENSSSDPDVARNNSGTFVVTWTDTVFGDNGVIGSNVMARRFATDGTAQGDAIVVVADRRNNGDIGSPRVAIDEAGDFVVVWQQNVIVALPLTSTRVYPAVHGQRFHADGTPDGREFVVTSRGGSPDVAMDADGDMVVAWAVDGTLLNGLGAYPFPISTPRIATADRIEARRYRANGLPHGLVQQIDRSPPRPLLINDRAPPVLLRPAVSMDGAGRYVVAWSSTVGSVDILAQAFDANGNASSGRYVISDGPASDGAFGVSLSMNRSGALVAAWSGGNRARIKTYDSSGAVLAPEFTAPDAVDGSVPFAALPTVSADAVGNFAVCSTTGGNFAFRLASVQLFRADGTPLTAALPATVGPTPPPSPLQFACSVAMRGDGETVLVYPTRGIIYAQRFAGP